MSRHFRTLLDLFTRIREDYALTEEASRPGFHAVVVHRFGNWYRTLPRIIAFPFAFVYWPAYWFVRNFYGIELPYRTKIGRRFRIGHQSGIVIHAQAEFGDDCIVRQNVTIGGINQARVKEAPKFGNRVEIGAGAVIIGPVIIGDDVRIAPNAVVTTNVPAGSIVVAPPCRIITPRRNPAPQAPAADSSPVPVAQQVSAGK